MANDRERRGMMKRICVLVFSIFLAQNIFANDKVHSVVVRYDLPRQIATGNLQIDLFGQKEIGLAHLNQEQSEVAGDVSHKSPWLAAGLSALLPGAGEFYAENYWKAALFFAVDVAAWTIAYSNDKKGDDQTTYFQSIADEKWNVVKYAEFSLNRFLSEAPENRRAVISANLIRDRNAALPSQRVDWRLMNEFEDYISRSQAGKYYSHRLPEYGEQQYFELIGKYPQFNPGWFDAPPDWVYSETDVSPTLKAYAVERGKANDYYARATTFVTVAIVNHVLSAFDAAWTASSYNKHLHASMQMQTIPTEFGFTQVPVTRVEYRF
jgi:hypothetical protein